MKCPKCGYIGFEEAARCKNCGYDFSLLVPSTELDLPLGTAQSESPAADYMLSSGAPLEETPGAGADAVRELPLFGNRDLEQAETGQVPPLPSGGNLGQADLRETAVEERRGANRAGGERRARHAVQGSRLRAQRLPMEAPGLDLEPTEPSGDERPKAKPADAEQLVSAGRRTLAALVDALILAGLDAAVVYFTLRVCRLSFADISVLPPAPLIAFFLLLDGGYIVAFTVFGGQTIGKMAASIKVTSEDGVDLLPSQALARTVGYLASALPAGLGFVPGLFGPARRALHDRLANTRVIRVR